MQYLTNKRTILSSFPHAGAASGHADPRLPLHRLEAGDVADEIGAIGIDEQPAFEAVTKAREGQSAEIDLAAATIGFRRPLGEFALDLEAAGERRRHAPADAGIAQGILNADA